MAGPDTFTKGVIKDLSDLSARRTHIMLFPTACAGCVAAREHKSRVEHIWVLVSREEQAGEVVSSGTIQHRLIQQCQHSLDDKVGSSLQLVYKRRPSLLHFPLRQAADSKTDWHRRLIVATTRMLRESVSKTTESATLEEEAAWWTCGLPLVYSPTRRTQRWGWNEGIQTVEVRQRLPR